MSDFTDNYTIFTPKLHNEKNPSPKKNPLLGDITYEFSQKALDCYGLKGVSFCFFVKWSSDFESGIMDNHIWIKKGLCINEPKLISLGNNDFFKKFYLNEPYDQIANKYMLMEHYNLILSYVLIKSLPLSPEPSANQSVMANLVYDINNKRWKLSVIKYKPLRDLILSYSGRSIKMGKNLGYYETELEKILTIYPTPNSAPFPGDCDLLLYDENMKCKAIIEFKKRTSQGKIRIREQAIKNYLDEDSLKYKRLNILREYMESVDGTSIPLIVVYFSTANDDDFRNIKLEAVSHSLTQESTDYFELTSTDVAVNHKTILEHILNL